MNQYFLKVVNYSDTAEFTETLKDTLKKYKIVHLKDVPETIDTKTFYSDLTDKMGEIVNVDEDINTGNSNINERWTDIRYDKANEFTFRHSNTRQPLHTDGAYMNTELDVNFFFCTENAEIGGATTFIDSDDLIYILEKYEPELYQKLCTVVVDFGKGENQRKQRLIIDRDDRGIKLNWNYYRVLPDNKPETIEMCEQFHRFLEDKVVAGGLLTPVYLKPGDAAFFQDDRTLHGRNSFYGARTLIKGGFNFN